MPSAARPFTGELVAELTARGVLFAPLTLHAGVSSLELGESPYPERYRVPAATARLVNAVHGWGGRVVAVGTTVVRALETVATGRRRPAGCGPHEPRRRPRSAACARSTGSSPAGTSRARRTCACSRPPRARICLERSYAAADARGYRFHEFGDSHLILP